MDKEDIEQLQGWQQDIAQLESEFRELLAETKLEPEQKAQEVLRVVRRTNNIVKELSARRESALDDEKNTLEEMLKQVRQIRATFINQL